jgi:hypothetical protein
MIERDFDDAEDAKSVRSSGRQFQLVVEILDGAGWCRSIGGKVLRVVSGIVTSYRI